MSNDDDFLGALASNAGDDFHVLWATREMLRLLDPDSDVEAVKVEGLPRDAIHDEVGEHGQAADVVLTRAADGGLVYQYLQLKHSASNPQDSWTWSRLLTRRAPTKPQSSVLGKLAGLMKSVKLRGDFAIVSNQPLASVVAADVERLIRNGVVPVSGDKQLFDRLTEQLQLTAEELLIFFEAWDLAAFASTSRLIMESEIIRQIAGMADSDARNDADLLQKRVSELMLPETRNDPAVTREMLLVWLGAGSKRMLFPAPSRIEPAHPYMRRAVTDLLTRKLEKVQAKPLRIHAGGGCGKTSLICDLASTLPSGSEIFVFDCYGGGLFLASDQKRHSPEQAFTQLGNELAARLRTPLVIRRQGSIDVFEALRSRVEVAADLVKLRGPEARLVLCFDAVDNARIGARHWHEPCFLDGLSQASGWPDNVRIVVSCRTARRDDVGSSSLYEDFEVPSFGVDEVRRLVSLWQPEWGSELATVLKNLTGGNPRRLVYAIQGLPQDGQARAVERLMPKAEGINPLFEQRVAEAGKQLGSVGKVWCVLDALSRLPRPVPGEVLATLAGISPADIGDIAGDVGGILEREEGWSFHDEDFEAFVVERPGGGGQALLARAADLLLETHSTDRYAATHCAEVLAAANRLDALYALVTEDEKPSEVLNSLEAQFVWSRRLSLAIRCCRTAVDITNACRLLIASADAVRRSELLENLTVENLDLSVRFAAEEANRLVMVSQRHRNKRPHLRIELAALEASTRPETAQAHLRWWHAHVLELRKADGPNGFDASVRDIAAEYEANAVLSGEAGALSHLLRWRPKSVLLSVFQVLAQRDAGRNRRALLDAIDARHWPPLALAPLMAAALLAGAGMGDAVMRRGLTRLAQATRARWSTAFPSGLSNSGVLAWQESVLLVCERATGYGDMKPLISQVLDRALPKPVLEESHHLYRLQSQGAMHARAYALHELVSGVEVPVTQWLPARREESPYVAPGAEGHQEKSPEARWNEVLAQASTTFSRCVDAARTTLASLATEPIAAWPALAKALGGTRRYDRSERRDSDAALLLMRNHIVHAGLSAGDVSGLVSAMRGVLRDCSADTIDRAQDLACTLALLPRTHDAALELLTAIAHEIETQPLPASERVKLFAQCARIALPLDAELAQWLFGKAVNASGAVDFEARGALAAAGAIALAGLGGSPSERAGLAMRLGDTAGAVAESLGVGGDFPWADVAGWTTAASLPAGLATASRWHDQGVTPFDNSLPKVVAAGNALSLAQRAALATLASDGPLDLDIVAASDEKLPDWLAAQTLEAHLQEGEIDRVLSALEAIKLRPGADTTGTVARGEHYRSTFEAWRGDGGPDRGAVAVDAENQAAESDFAPFLTRDEVQSHMTGLVGMPGVMGARVLGAYQFIEVARRLGSRALRVPFLDIALDLGRHDGEFGEAVPEILAHWSSYPPVTSWLRERFPEYIRGAVPALFHLRYGGETDTLEAALAATGLTPVEQADILLGGIEQQRTNISAHVLYAVTGLIAARTPVERRVDLFDALLRRVEGRTSHPARVALAGIRVPEDVGESVARTVFAAMGDMDRRVRWRAGHAALALLRGADPAWIQLLGCLVAADEHVFASTPFYRYAALEQLLTVLLRATAESARTVAPHVPLVLELIRSEPHVMVRELGRSILLALHAAGAWKAAGEELAYLERVNRSQLTPTRPLNRYRRSVGRTEQRERPERKYHFDDTDAIPYWYASAADLFDMPMDLFLDRLESWIHVKWGYDVTATHWKREPRLARLEGLHDMTSRRHGTRPIVERLSYHIEWHAMMCAVGEFIEELPLAKSSNDRALESWIEDNLPTEAPYWLSDLRGAPPLEPRFWGIAPTRLPEGDNTRRERQAEARAWGCTLSSSVFDREITASDDLVVAGDFALRWGDALQNVRIHSALATPSTAKALAQALANARSRMDFALPHGVHHDDLKVSGFRLESWLQTVERDPKADVFDARRGTTSGFPACPVGAAHREDLTFDVLGGSWQLATGARALEIAQWGSGDSVNGHGWRTRARRDFLLDLLKQNDRSLILLAELSRQLRGDDLPRNPTQWMLYVFDANGTLTRFERERRSIGRFLVRREGLHNSVDTLGRWMLHRIAELEGQHKTADKK